MQHGTGTFSFVETRPGRVHAISKLHNADSGLRLLGRWSARLLLVCMFGGQKSERQHSSRDIVIDEALGNVFGPAIDIGLDRIV